MAIYSGYPGGGLPVTDISSGYERDPGIANRGGEVFVLGEKTIAGMDRVGAESADRVEQRVNPQVALARR